MLATCRALNEVADTAELTRMRAILGRRALPCTLAGTVSEGPRAQRARVVRDELNCEGKRYTQFALDVSVMRERFRDTGTDGVNL